MKEKQLNERRTIEQIMILVWYALELADDSGGGDGGGS